MKTASLDVSASGRLTRWHTVLRHLATASFLFGQALVLAASPPPDSPRVRISIDDNWRFTRGDPTNGPVNLLYDAREPKTIHRLAEAEADGNAAVNEPADESTNPPPAVIKAWILPTGNDFIKDAARRFIRPAGNPGAGVACVQPGFDDSSWQQVNLPHDWAIAGPFIRTGGGGMGRLPSAGVGWYRKQLDLPAADAGKSIFVDVDGAMSYATLWLNGRLVGGWPYGYASWRADLTSGVKPGGKNELVIRLDNPPNSSRWYPGGGIYHNVWLVKTFPVHVGHWGTCVTTPEISPAAANVHLQVTVDNDASDSAEVSISTEIFSIDANDHKVGAVTRITPMEIQVAPRGHATIEGTGTIAHPKLWGPPPQQRPNRYVAVTSVTQGGKVVDTYETPFGIRSIKFDPNLGFFINGEHILLNGVCDHHDLGALGAAVNYRALQRQLEMLADMGCNALRTSHNPPAPELLELADKMGFLVMNEACDVWVRQKTPMDFHLIFPDWHEQDLRAQIHRDRNCPSVILWSIGNEVGEQFTGTNGVGVATQLRDIVHDEDPTRPVTSAMNWSQPGDPLPAVLDVIGLNYQGAGNSRRPRKIPGLPRKISGQGDFRQRNRLGPEQSRRLCVPRGRRQFGGGRRELRRRPDATPGERV